MDLSALVNKAMLCKGVDEKRPYIGASAIGSDCSRSIWYNFKGYDRSLYNPKAKINFEIGKKLEKLFVEAIEEAGVKVIKPTHDNDYLFVQDESVPLFQGHMDGILVMPNGEECVLEFKTAKNSSFMRFVKGGAKNWSNNYYAQIQSYMGMSGIHMSVLLAVNKDTSELFHEYVYFDEDYYQRLRMKAVILSTCDEAPDRINKNPCFYLCSGCPYKGVCHGK